MTTRRDFTFYYVLAFAALPLISVLVPRVMAFGPVLLGLAGTLYLLRNGADRRGFSRPYLVVAGGAGLLACASALWADFPADVLEKGFLTALLLLSGVFTLYAAEHLDRERLRACAWLIPVLLLAAAAVAAFELALNMPIYRLVHWVGPDERLYTAVINRGAVNTVLCLFAALAIVQGGAAFENRKQRMVLLAGLLCMILLMLALSQAQVAQLAFVAGLIVYTFYPAGRAPGIVFMILAGVSCALFFLSPWLAQWMFANLAAETQNLAWLKSGYAANRMEIWDMTARYALQAPLTGHGLDATRYVESFDHARLYHREAGVLHPHNFALQIWTDFGLLGVLPACAALAYLYRRVFMVGGIAGKAVMAMLLTTLLVAAISYGLWQSHWLGVMIYVLALCRIVMRLHAPVPTEG